MFSKMLEKCELCPRRCGVNRAAGELGACKAGKAAKVYSCLPHHGEEPCLSGAWGSGTIFFSHCTARCVYCQNYIFSQQNKGREVSNKRLALMMLELQAKKCHNINLVTPTHYLPQILDALSIAKKNGLAIPIVYNTGGWERLEVLKLLKGIVDIYLVDMRYSSDEMAKKYSSLDNYTPINQAAVLEMHRQTGICSISSDGLIWRCGLIIRHLVMPEGIAGTEAVMKFLAEKVSKDVYISLMSQYHPAYKAKDYSSINRRITSDEYQMAADIVAKYGLRNGWFQPDITEDITKKFIGTNFKRNV